MRKLATAVFLIFFFCAGGPYDKLLAKEHRHHTSRVSRKSHSPSFRNAIWGDKMKELEQFHSTVSQSLSSTTFQFHKHSSSSSFKSSFKSFRSHGHKARHVRHGKRKSRK